MKFISTMRSANATGQHRSLFRYRLALIPIAMLLFTSVSATPIVVAGKEWQQVADFTGVLHDEIETVCGLTTGFCSGQLNNIDISGWTWASSDDVAGLFQAIGSGHPGGNTYVNEIGSVWAPAFFDSLGFVPTSSDSTRRYVAGLSRDSYFIPGGYGRSPRWYDYTPTLFDYFGDQVNDQVTTGSGISTSSGQSWLGAWFTRDALEIASRAALTSTSVPAPPTTLLMFSALVLLAGGHLRESQRQRFKA